MKIYILIIIFLVFAADIVSSQERIYHSVSTDNKIVIDGTLDEKDWNDARKETDFSRTAGYVVLDQTSNNKLAEEQTSFSILYDNENIYLGVECADADITGIKAIPSAIVKKDRVELFICEDNAGKCYYHFIVDIAGNKYVEIMDGDTADKFMGAPPRKLDIPWAAKSRRKDGGWTVEVLIPWKSLGVDNNPDYKMLRFNLARVRVRPDSSKFSSWCYSGRDFNSPDRFGMLLFGNNHEKFKRNTLEPLKIKYAEKQKEILDFEKENGHSMGTDAKAKLMKLHDISSEIDAKIDLLGKELDINNVKILWQLVENYNDSCKDFFATSKKVSLDLWL